MDVDKPGHINQVLSTLKTQESNSIIIDGEDKTAEFEITDTTTISDIYEQLNAKGYSNQDIRIGSFAIKYETIGALVSTDRSEITPDLVLNEEGQNKLMWATIIYRANHASDLNTLDRSLHQITDLTKDELKGFNELLLDLVGDDRFKSGT